MKEEERIMLLDQGCFRNCVLMCDPEKLLDNPSYCTMIIVVVNMLNSSLFQ